MTAPATTITPEPATAPVRDRTWLIAAAILLAALAVRVAFVLATRDISLANDPADYHRLAVNVANGHGFGGTVLAAGGGPTAFRSPLYPFALGLLYDVVGVSVTGARLVQAALGTVTVALIGLFAAHLFGRKVGLVAAAIAAVYPPLVLDGGSLMTESIALPALLGMLLLALEYRRRHDIRWAVAAGVVAGVGVLTRENFLVLLAPLALVTWTPPRVSLRSLAAPAALVVAALAIVAPWTVRNAVRMDAFIPVSDTGGYVWGGVYNSKSDHNPRFPAAFIAPSEVPAYRDLFADRSLDEKELADALQHRAREYATDHPTYVAKVVFWNSLRLFDLTGFDFGRVVGGSLGYSARVSDLALVGWYLVAPFGLVGAWLARRRLPWELWLVPVTIWATTVLALGTFRYRAPIEPFVLAFAAVTACAIHDRVTTRAGAIAG
jgi:4-amino-4-deoxy-L-arabinose transferase-like glycosyltransferase